MADALAHPSAAPPPGRPRPALDPALDPAPGAAGLVAGANPVAKLAAATVLALALVVTLDPVSSAVALAGELLALPLCGVAPAGLRRRLAVVAAAAAPSGLATALLGPDAGRVVLAVGPLSLTTGSALTGLAVGLRIAAVALPGVVLLATTDTTDLADALAQVLHLPARVVLAGLAAVRLVEVLAQEWRQLGLARRARGLGDDGPLGRASGLVGRAFALLVLALRRASVLATAMEARGFGGAGARTWARPSRLGRGDGILVGAATCLALAATAAALAAGTWHAVLR